MGEEPGPLYEEGQFVFVDEFPHAALIVGLWTAKASRFSKAKTVHHYAVKSSALLRATGPSQPPASHGPDCGTSCKLAHHGMVGRGVKWVAEGAIRGVHVVQESEFRLLDLPMPALASVLRHLGWSCGVEVAPLCRKLAAAFADGGSWHRQVLQDTDQSEAEVLQSFDASGAKSWMEYYRTHGLWNIRIVTVFRHRGGRSLSGDFTIQVQPGLSVRAFLTAVMKHPKNKQTRGGCNLQRLVKLKPHDPRQLTRAPPDLEIAGPNCQFDATKHDISVREAGLRNGAVLEQPEMLRKD